MARMKKIEGLAGIDAAIKQFVGIAGNLEQRVQAICVAITDHAANAGNGDMSRALKLVKAMKRYRSLNTAFVIGWFRHFASTTINLRANDGAGKVSLMSRDAKGYRGFDVAGAKANNWFDAVDSEGNRAPWYAGPTPEDYTPETVGNIADRMHRFVKNTAKLLTDTKEVRGKEVPLVQLTEGDEQQVTAALAFIDRIANTLARHEEMAQLEAKLAEVASASEQDNEVIEVLTTEAPVVEEKAVA